MELLILNSELSNLASNLIPSVVCFLYSVKQSGKCRTSGSLWPPFRIPSTAASPYVDPRHILLNKVFQGILFAIFYKLVHTTQFSDQVASLAIYLLEMALSVCDTVGAQVTVIVMSVFS